MILVDNLIIKMNFDMYMGQKIQDGKNIQYSSLFFLKGKTGVGWEMKVSKFCQVLPFPNGQGI